MSPLFGNLESDYNGFDSNSVLFFILFHQNKNTFATFKARMMLIFMILRYHCVLQQPINENITKRENGLLPVHT